MNTYLSMDVGGTNVNAGLVDEEGRILARRRFPTKSAPTKNDLTGDMLENLKSLLAEAPAGAAPRALGVGLPGWIDYREGLLVKAPNMPPGWVNVPVVDILEKALGLPVRLENDANIYALGEWKYGAGRGYENLLVITLGTGVGGGLILNEKVWYGSFFSAAEVGHIPVEARKGALCGCGRRGCLETVASATGMSRLAREYLELGGESLYRGAPEEINAEILYGLARKGDRMALYVFDRAGEALGLILSGAVNLLGLPAIVIGGGAAGALDFIKPRLDKVIAEHVLVAEPERIKILRASLGDDAPLLGGAILAKSSIKD